MKMLIDISCESSIKTVVEEHVSSDIYYNIIYIIYIYIYIYI